MKKTLAIFSTLMLSACVSSPSTTPQVATVAPETLGLGADAAPLASDNWWSAFNDPQINRLVAVMEKDSPTLAGALARMRSAQAELSVNEAADLPQVSLDGNEQRLQLSKDYIIPPPYAGTWRWMGQLSANLTWNLDFWGKQAALIEKARDKAQAAALDAAAARLALSGALAQSYVALMLTWQEGDIADASVAERTQILSLTQSRFDSGLENESAVEQAKALLSDAKVSAQRIAVQRDVNIHALVALTGQGAVAYAEITRPMPKLDAVLPLPASLPADLLSRRPDILAARARIDAATKSREAAHADFYPDINLTALIGFQAIGLANLLSANSFTVGAGPAIHLPIFDAGKIRAQYAGATADLDEAVAEYNGTVLNAIKQTADALSQVKGLQGQLRDQQEALASATRAYDLAAERYRLGLAPQIPVLNAEASLLSAREQMAALAAQSVTQRVTLLLSVGGSFRADTMTLAKQD